MTKGELEHGALGEYSNSKEICEYMFKLGAGRIVRVHQLLNQTEIVVTNSIQVIFKYQ